MSKDQWIADHERAGERWVEDQDDEAFEVEMVRLGFDAAEIEAELKEMKCALSGEG